ncbi:hypothetical protein V8J88_24980 [Massilia sp. W12]|uniref:hypothetical protein n=1 Tax=Massilia sp. W12 TaxID=3126507 RepID=UPI0030D04778
MAGHSLLNQVHTKNEVVMVDEKPYTVILSYNKVAGIDGYVVGLKFTNAAGSMDSAEAKPVNGMQVGLAIAHRAAQMLNRGSTSSPRTAKSWFDKLGIMKLQPAWHIKRLVSAVAE